jgi:hypothetical protein
MKLRRLSTYRFQRIDCNDSDSHPCELSDMKKSESFDVDGIHANAQLPMVATSSELEYAVESNNTKSQLNGDNCGFNSEDQPCDNDDDVQCMVCMEQRVDAILLECGHR